MSLAGAFRKRGKELLPAKSHENPPVISGHAGDVMGKTLGQPVVVLLSDVAAHPGRETNSPPGSPRPSSLVFSAISPEFLVAPNHFVRIRSPFSPHDIPMIKVSVCPSWLVISPYIAVESLVVSRICRGP